MKVKTYVLLLIGVWIGMVLGLSFIEAPLKFTAPGITTQLGVGIGQIIFKTSNYIQLGFLCLFAASVVFNKVKLSKNMLLFFIGLVVLMLLQTLYLLPILDQRASLTIANQSVEKSWHHLGFVLFEIMKLCILATLFIKLQPNA